MTNSRLRFGFRFETNDADPCDSKWNLFHHVLTGDLEVNGVASDLSARFGWVPLLNVALQFDTIARRLSDENGFASLEFTESDDRLDFVHHKGVVNISGTYTDASADVPVREVLDALHAFRQWAAEEAVRRHSCLRQRPEFVKEFTERRV